MAEPYDNAVMKVLRAIDESPAMQAFRAMEDTQVVRLGQELSQSTAWRALTEMRDSPVMKAVRDLNDMPLMRDMEDSPALNAYRRIEASADLAAFQRIEEHPAMRVMQALSDHPSLEAFSSIADRLAAEHGALTFFDAYAWLADEYDQRTSEETPEPLDGLADSVQQRAACAPAGALSLEFYFNVILALVLFYLSHVLAGESEQRVMERIGEIEQALLGQMEALPGSSDGAIYLVAGGTVEFREEPSEEYEVQGVLRPYQKVHQIELRNDWIRIEYFDHVSNEVRKGWIHCGDVSAEPRDGFESGGES